MDAAAEIRLGHLNFAEFSRTDASWQRTYEVVEHDGLLCWAGASDFPAYCNGAIRTDEALDPDVAVARACQFFGRRGRGFSLFARVLPLDEGLGEAAEARGGVRIIENPQLVCRRPLREREPPSGVELRWVRDLAGMTDFASVNATAYATYGAPEASTRSHFSRLRGFTAPHVHSVVGHLDGRPVGAAQVLLTHGIGGVYWVGVVEEARGRGIADTVTRAVTNRAFELGAAQVQLQASTMGDSLYRRMGYEELHGTAVWLMPGSDDASGGG